MKRYLLYPAAAIAILLSTSAYAIDFKAEMKSLDDKPIPTSVSDPTPVTLGKVCEEALIADHLPNDTPDAKEKNSRFWLAKKIHEAKEPLTAEEIAMAKKVVGMAYGPLIIGRAYELLDPASKP